MTPVVEGVTCTELKYSVTIEAVTQQCVVRLTSTQGAEYEASLDEETLRYI